VEEVGDTRALPIWIGHHVVDDHQQRQASPSPRSLRHTSGGRGVQVIVYCALPWSEDEERADELFLHVLGIHRGVSLWICPLDR